MTGGMAYVYDPGGDFEMRINPDTLLWNRVTESYWADHLRELVTEHARETQSLYAERLLNEWNRTLGRFWTAVPRDYARFLPVPIASEVMEKIPAE